MGSDFVPQALSPEVQEWKGFGSFQYVLRISQKQPQICIRLADCWMAYALQTSSPYFSHSDFTHLRFVRETKAFVYGYKRQ